ncbi:hypothetical protein HPB50_008991 [Hyalomma asiaticum]|uniref:Uncharacterized protein n=1 Tax=Hyalomma asiaticum TaxID=266040 RepID=A0ACB7RW97_HYAAI|nr:hypothetical protein HPB50_008991 [Hyalomma asiaticum]
MIQKFRQHDFSVHISDEDISCPNHDMEVVAFIAGYCAHSALKELSCVFCSSTVVLDNRNIIDVESSAMIANLSRGGLKFPQPCTRHVVLVTTLIVEKLTEGDHAKPFFACSNQRGIISPIATSLLGYVEIENCENGHMSETLVFHVVRAATNVALNNFCKLRNDAIESTAQKKDADR